MSDYIKPVIDRIEWADNADLPTEVSIPENTFTDYYEVIKYLTDRFNTKPKAFRWRQNELLNGYRDWGK